MRLFFFLMLLALLPPIVACAPPPALAEESLLTLPPPAVRTALPTALPTPQPSATPESAATAQPPTPTALPTPNNANYPRSVQVPSWPYVPPRTTGCGTTNGVVYRAQYPVHSDGPMRDYIVYLPPCYSNPGPGYPVLYLLHGSVEDETHWLTLGLVEHLNYGIATGLYPPLIAVLPASGPTSNITSGGERSPAATFANDLIPYIDSHYCTVASADGRAIGGISRGGYWALMLAFWQPELFGAVAGHSPQLNLDSDAALYNPLRTYSQASLNAMRIWLDWGERDFLHEGPAELHRRLTAAGIDHQITVNAGRHEATYWVTHLPDYLAFYTAEWPPDRTVYPPCRTSP